MSFRTGRGSASVRRVEQVRHYFDRGDVHFETVVRDSIDSLPVAVEETTLVKITLDRAPQSQGILNERTLYGDKLLQPTGSAVTFKIETPNSGVGTARLRICLSRHGGFGDRLSVRLNGRRIARGLPITPVRKSGNYWGYHIVDVPADLVRAQNEIEISVPEDGGTITSVALNTTELEMEHGR